MLIDIWTSGTGQGDEIKRFITPFKNDLRPKINSRPMYRRKITDIYNDINCTPIEYQTCLGLTAQWWEAAIIQEFKTFLRKADEDARLGEGK